MGQVSRERGDPSLRRFKAIGAPVVVGAIFRRGLMQEPRESGHGVEGVDAHLVSFFVSTSYTIDGLDLKWGRSGACGVCKGPSA